MRSKYKKFFDILEDKKYLSNIDYYINNNSVVFDGSLFLIEYSDLKFIPDNLTVKGSLILQGCTGLTSLPHNMRVKYHLILRGCTGIRSLPSDMIIGSRLCLSGCKLYPFDSKTLNVFDIYGKYEILHNSKRFICEE